MLVGSSRYRERRRSDLINIKFMLFIKSWRHAGLWDYLTLTAKKKGKVCKTQTVGGELLVGSFSSRERRRSDLKQNNFIKFTAVQYSL